MSYRYGTPLPILQQVISSEHFQELWLHDGLYPRGDRRADYQAALIAQTIHNVHCTRARDCRPLQDFLLPGPGEDAAAAAAADPKAAARRAAAQAARWVRQCEGAARAGRLR